MPEALDDPFDRRLRKLPLPESIADFALAARAVGEERRRGLERPRLLVLEEQLSRLEVRQRLADSHQIEQILVEADGVPPVDEDVDPATARPPLRLDGGNRGGRETGVGSRGFFSASIHSPTPDPCLPDPG